jgi:hypothetical protein
MKRFQAGVGGLLGCAGAFVGSVAWAQPIIQQYVLTGDPAPGPDGAVFSSVEAAVINDRGDIAFEAFVQPGENGPFIQSNDRNRVFSPFSGSGSPLGLIARGSDTAPGTGGRTFGQAFNWPLLNEAGQVAFRVRLNSSSAGIFAYGIGSGVTSVAVTGDPVPGLGGVELGDLSLDSGLLDDGGVVFSGFLQSGTSGPAVDGANDSAIFRRSAQVGSGVEVLFREGDEVPGLGGVVFGSLQSYSPLVTANALGDFAFHTRLVTGASGPTVAADEDQVILGPAAGPGSSIGIVAREGQQAPGTGGAEFDHFSKAIGLNTGGDIAFYAELRTGDTGPSVRSGDNEAIFGPVAGPGSPLGLLAREGDAAPDADGFTFNRFGPFNQLAFNDQGDVAFLASLESDDRFTDDIQALYAYRQGTPQIIVRTGDVVQVTLADASVVDQTVSEIFFASQGLNHAGQLAFGLSFAAGGGSGIFTAVIPEPSTSLLVIGAGGLMFRGRRYRRGIPG